MDDKLFICPTPGRWAQIYEVLITEYERLKACNLGGHGRHEKPPVPLILAGWAFSSDAEKKTRWASTVQWAERHDLLHLMSVAPHERYYDIGDDGDFNIHDEFTTGLMKELQLGQSVTAFDYLEHRAEALRDIPDKPGVYLVINPLPSSGMDFLETGTGGSYKGKNPNVTRSILYDKWLENASVLYIGKAGGGAQRASLRTRILELVRFGTGAAAPHWGGRYLWQCEGSLFFQIYWFPTEGADAPVDLERHLINRFIRFYGSKPFANIR